MSHQPQGRYEPPRWQPQHGRPLHPLSTQHGKIVTRGKVGGSGHSIHAILTLFSCGLWAPIWFLHWLFTRKKTVTRY